ncbi:3-oxoacyl-ACP reductase [Mycobacterium mantenii]|uniref:3-oxoacyl-ACP reductase n=1 Tax=Mycobacterium mantenii TaxID=560555 RepID=A0A1X0F8R7_MYCNT|nr:SDR family oxidoreductase [Mycobacterium mantenii]MCV7246147.1 SDR family oxidoreductase [Mycobacterium mantenii]ORA97827.1 dehydrogenase [Mycobacterium mantenii]BBY37985.1 3-oxoacyl-ACP reductase [Mycobacterium mantenii]
MGRLDERVGIVTGAAQSIGREYALGAAAEGARVVVADIVDPAPVVAEIEASGGEALGVTVDVSSQESTEKMAAAALERFGRVDFLVNNAALYGALRVQSWLDIDVGEWDRVMAVNVRGMFLCCKAVVPAMIQQGAGKIINISSGTALAGMPGLLHYVTSKAAVIGFTRALAREVGVHGITVNTLTPGVTMSEGTTHLFENSGLPVSDRMVQLKCIQREQTAQDLLGAVVFLASPDSDFITAQVVNVDGGWNAV